MTAMVAQNSSAVLSGWHGQLRVHGAIVLSILMVIGVLGYRVDRATRLQALRDGLTGLANRRCFNETIEREFQRAARTGRPLSLIMVDIDLFKTFNDQYGHRRATLACASSAPPCRACCAGRATWPHVMAARNLRFCYRNRILPAPSRSSATCRPPFARSPSRTRPARSALSR
jgi:hypothetical protein